MSERNTREKICMKEYPIRERPMEKLVERGREALSDEELLAILIGTGSRNKNALELADGILRQKRERSWLIKAGVEELKSYEGIGTSKSCRIIAGIELGLRLSRAKNFYSISLNSPKTVANYLKSLYAGEEREIFCTIFLDSKNKPIGREIISIGTLNQTMVHPREVYRAAISNGACSIMISHNHPSGDPEPSQEDILVTKRLAKVGDLVGIPVLDHLIIGKEDYISLKQRGVF